MPDAFKPLEYHDDKPVISAKIKLTNVGDGLSASMSIDPQIIREGDVITFVGQAICTKVGYEPATKGDYSGPQVRVHTLSGQTMAVADDEVQAVIAAALDAHRKAVLAAHEVPGQRSIEDDLDDDEEDDDD